MIGTPWLSQAKVLGAVIAAALLWISPVVAVGALLWWVLT